MEKVLYTNHIRSWVMQFCFDDQTLNSYLRLYSKSNVHSCQVDYPIRYENGVIAYDRPEMIPKYVKAAVEQFYKNVQAHSRGLPY